MALSVLHYLLEQALVRVLVMMVLVQELKTQKLRPRFHYALLHHVLPAVQDIHQATPRVLLMPQLPRSLQAKDLKEPRLYASQRLAWP